MCDEIDVDEATDEFSGLVHARERCDGFRDRVDEDHGALTGAIGLVVDAAVGGENGSRDGQAE